MKKLLTLLFLGIVFSCSMLQAQSYTVFSLRGEVKTIKGKSSSDVKLRAELTPETVISVPSSGRIILLDQVGSKLYTISRPCKGSIKELIAQNGEVSFQAIFRLHHSSDVRQGRHRDSYLLHGPHRQRLSWRERRFHGDGFHHHH